MEPIGRVQRPEPWGQSSPWLVSREDTQQVAPMAVDMSAGSSHAPPPVAAKEPLPRINLPIMTEDAVEGVETDNSHVGFVTRCYRGDSPVGVSPGDLLPGVPDEPEAEAQRQPSAATSPAMSARCSADVATGSSGGSPASGAAIQEATEEAASVPNTVEAHDDVDAEITSDAMEAEALQEISRAKAKEAFRSNFLEELKRVGSPHTAAIEVLRQCSQPGRRQAESAARAQLEAKRVFQEAFQKQTDRGLSPNSAAVELIRKYVVPVKQGAPAVGGPGDAGEGQDPPPVEEAEADLTEKAPVLKTRGAAEDPSKLRKLNESQQLLAEETGRSSPLPA